jgi:hypothetical protein
MLHKSNDNTVSCQKSVSQPALDKWYDFVAEILTTMPPDQPYLVIYDLTHPAVGLTPYLRERANQLNSIRPEVGGRIALLMKHTPAAHLFQLFARMRRRKSRREIQIFFDEQKAIRWLKELIP